ncbi:MAG TPA: hypothetical protein VL970_05395 [Candidatus Acidoferrales bacterium]|nr:hypothetical protein [Candidatus Acidoferrales bacterium]
MAPGSASLRALTIVVALGAMAHAAMPYLPLIGPPSLRVPAVKSLAAEVVKFEANQGAPLPATNPPPVIASEVSPGKGDPTNAAASALAYALALPAPAPETPLSNTFTSSVFELPTPDLLGISPQMLAGYFHPVEPGTNSAVMTGMFPLSFTPPLPPDKSSRAEYNVK